MLRADICPSRLDYTMYRSQDRDIRKKREIDAPFLEDLACTGGSFPVGGSRVINLVTTKQ